NDTPGGEVGLKHELVVWAIGECANSHSPARQFTDCPGSAFKARGGRLDGIGGDVARGRCGHAAEVSTIQRSEVRGQRLGVGGQGSGGGSGGLMGALAGGGMARRVPFEFDTGETPSLVMRGVAVLLVVEVAGVAYTLLVSHNGAGVAAMLISTAITIYFSR